MTFSPRDYYLLLKLRIIIIPTWQGVILSCTVPHALPHARPQVMMRGIWGQISTFNIDSVFICDIMNHGSAIEDSISKGELTRRERGGIAAEMLYKYSGLTQAQIAELLWGVDYGAVYQLRSRMKERLTQDNVLQLQYGNIEQTIKESVEC